MTKDIRDSIFFRHPIIKILITNIQTLIGGVLTGWLIVDITENDEINWSLVLYVTSFWCMVVFLIITTILSILFYNHDKDIFKWSDRMYLLSRINKDLMSDYTEAAKKRIASGEIKNPADLEREFFPE